MKAHIVLLGAALLAVFASCSGNSSKNSNEFDPSEFTQENLDLLPEVGYHWEDKILTCNPDSTDYQLFELTILSSIAASYYKVDSIDVSTYKDEMVDINQPFKGKVYIKEFKTADNKTGSIIYICADEHCCSYCITMDDKSSLTAFAESLKDEEEFVGTSNEERVAATFFALLLNKSLPNFFKGINLEKKDGTTTRVSAFLYKDEQ